MPLYPFRCDACGDVEELRSTADATASGDCPTCSGPTRRVYTPPGGRSRSGLAGTAGGQDRQRLDRARTGEPVVTAGAPAGRRLPASPHRH